MSHTSVAWKGEGDPYGLPSAGGNADRIWRLLTTLPCADCGATSKSLVVEKEQATIHCGSVGEQNKE